MRIQSMLRSIGAILALLGLLVATTSVGRAANAAVALTSSPDMVAVQAQGFQSDEVITVWLTGPRGQAVATDAYYHTDSQGEARFLLELDVANEVGTWTITVYGLDSELEAYAQIQRETVESAADDDSDDEDSDEDDEDSDEDDEDSDTDGDGDTDGDSD